MSTALDAIRIVLVEPAGPLNVGAIARIMKNMGLRHLVLVRPQCDPGGAEARQMAVHGVEVLEQAHLAATLAEALQGCQRAIATMGRDRTTLDVPLENPRAALPWLLQQEGDAPVAPAAVLFGREDRGLTNEELNYAQRFIRIPASSAYLSLNLAQAVAICCYELFVAAMEPPLGETELGSPFLAHSEPCPPLPTADLAPLDHLEQYYQQLEALLLHIGYLYPHTVASRMEKFRRLLNRAYPSTTDVAMLRGILRQARWALNNAASTAPLPPPLDES